VGARLLVADGRVEREAEHAEVPIVHLIVRSMEDRSDLLDRLHRPEGVEVRRGAWGERALGGADEARRPEPGSRGGPAPARMPRSRDFR
jgi:error-prone DNA polymerase